MNFESLVTNSVSPARSFASWKKNSIAMEVAAG
jgi:hypothetical protein